MTKKLIFISCGQLTNEERQLGQELRAFIGSTLGFEAYFADEVQDLKGLSSHVFAAISQCCGAIIVLQDRGCVLGSNGLKLGHRSSVWINQEIAILAYRHFFEDRRLPILAFKEDIVRLEGAMTSLILNPKPLPPKAELLDAVSNWLAKNEFSESDHQLFVEKWTDLSDDIRLVVAALIAEGGRQVKEASVRSHLKDYYKMDSNTASSVVQSAKLAFMTNGLVQLVRNLHSGDELSLHPTWEYELRRQCGQWLAGRKGI